MWDLIVSVADHCLSFYFTSPEIALQKEGTALVGKPGS